MSQGKAKTWFWSPAGFVALPLVALPGLLQSTRGGDKGHEGALAPTAYWGQAG